ncbi:MAG: hypothetical protein M1819_003606 [Sarea resinae]|nr:MAG: hypothetical protein M1819_003606 [Sarea resinae]
MASSVHTTKLTGYSLAREAANDPTSLQLVVRVEEGLPITARVAAIVEDDIKDLAAFEGLRETVLVEIVFDDPISDRDAKARSTLGKLWGVRVDKDGDAAGVAEDEKYKKIPRTRTGDRDVRPRQEIWCCLKSRRHHYANAFTGFPSASLPLDKINKAI